ncbi:MAG: LacI family DNA-binding transcriptional regulator [Treponema sp.]|jgi:LacI family transcriptional regulator|nr:LacI family DNA-binding transcriptional regulator [Treponema sp.]
MITSKKIAEMAGVSRGTVDRVLNNRGDVSEATKQKILEIVRLLNYKPSRAGKILVSHQKKIKIGCIIISAQNPFYDELYRGIMLKVEEYSSYGIEIIVERVEFKGETQCVYIDKLLTLDINAMMIQPINEAVVAQKLRDLAQEGLPIVTTNTNVEGFTPLCHVGNDFFTCGKTAANLLDLITGGKCNIGIVTGFSKACSHADRIDGFYEYIKERAGMNIVSLVENCDDEVESFLVTKKLLEDNPEIDAIFLVAGGVYGAGKAIKTLYDRFIKVISFDDVPTTKELIREGIIQATICQQPVRQSILSLEILFDYLIDNKRPSGDKIYTDIQIKLKSNIDLHLGYQ